MNAQGRTRLLVGGLTLVALALVIGLLLSQRSTPPPVAVDSPLAEDLITAANGGDEAEVQSDSPFAEVASDDTTPAPSTSVISSEAPITQTTSAADSSTVTESAQLAPPVAMTATSTVTVTLVASEPQLYGYEVVATYPHDPEAFTQGLQYVEGVLYEGTGLNGASSLRRVDLTSGRVEQKKDLDDQYFGEGIVVIEDRIYQLTWQNQVAFLYDRESFELLDEFQYPTEGWGLTYDGEELIMSDGSSTLFRRDPDTFAEVGRVAVNYLQDPVNLLNELEYIDGEVWANIWRTNQIVIINPLSGQVRAVVDLTGLLPSEEQAEADVLNGIAYDASNQRIFVTGKLWPSLFEIKLVPR